MANPYADSMLQSIRDYAEKMKLQKAEDDAKRLAQGNTYGGIAGLLTSLLMDGDLPSNLISGAKGYLTPNTEDSSRNIMQGAASGYDTATAYKKTLLDQATEAQKMQIEKAKALATLSKEGTIIPEGQIPEVKTPLSLEQAQTLPGIVSGARPGYEEIPTVGGSRFIPQTSKSLADKLIKTEKKLPENALKVDVLGGYFTPQSQKTIDEPMPTSDPGKNRQWVPEQTFKTVDGKLVKVNSWKSEPIKTGTTIITPGQEASIALQLSNQYRADAKEFQGVRDGYTRILKSKQNPSAAGDLAILYNYMKMLDPGSVVRESEFALGQNAGSLPQKLKGQYERVVSGKMLDNKVRNDLTNRASMLYSGATSQYVKLKKDYTLKAKRFGVDPGRVITDYSQAEDINVSPGAYIPEEVP